nr:MAG TPA: hypothetical protein [Caudoviricetes sp.]
MSYGNICKIQYKNSRPCWRRNGYIDTQLTKLKRLRLLCTPQVLL